MKKGNKGRERKFGVTWEDTQIFILVHLLMVSELDQGLLILSALL